MSASISIQDQVTPLLARIQSAAQAQGLNLIGAQAAADLLREHLLSLDSQRHRGGRHFYAQAADAITVTATAAGATINIDHPGLFQRRYGGPIHARAGSALTIPASAAARGRRAGEFSGLRLASAINPATGRLQPALVRSLAAPAPVRNRGQSRAPSADAPRAGEVMYWLTKYVYQRPDPTVLPSDEALNASALAAIQSALPGIN